MLADKLSAPGKPVEMDHHWPPAERHHMWGVFFMKLSSTARNANIQLLISFRSFKTNLLQLLHTYITAK